MVWTRLIALDEVPVGAARSVRAGPDDLLVCRTGADVVYVLEDVCSHDEAPIGDQEIDDGMVTCPRHGARFDCATGDVRRSPAPVGIEVFPSRIEAGWVEVELED